MADSFSSPVSFTEQQKRTGFWHRYETPVRRFILLWTICSAVLLIFATLIGGIASGSETNFGSAFVRFLGMIIAVGILLLATAVFFWVWGYFFPGLRGHLFGISADTRSIQERASLSREVSSVLKLRGQLNASETALLDRLSVMKEIDKRVARLRDRTGWILGAIAASLMAAAFVVLFAGRLTSLDAEAVSNIDKARTELASAQAQLARLYKYQDLFRDLDKLKERESASTSEPGARSEISKQISEKTKDISNLSDFSSRSSVAPGSSASAQQMIATAEANVKTLNGLLGDVWKAELLAEHGYNDWRYIVATAITRLGVVLIIVFLVQILMGLYRYNTRLIAYYNSRRDLLTLWEGDPKKLQPLNAVMAPPTFDFGKDPKHPLEDLIRAIGGQVNKSVRSSSHDQVAENK